MLFRITWMSLLSYLLQKNSVSKVCDFRFNCLCHLICGWRKLHVLLVPLSFWFFKYTSNLENSNHLCFSRPVVFRSIFCGKWIFHQFSFSFKYCCGDYKFIKYYLANHRKHWWRISWNVSKFCDPFTFYFSFILASIIFSFQ